MSAITPDKAFSSELILFIPDYFEQIRRALAQDSSGPGAFAIFLRHLAHQFDAGDSQESFLRLQNFGVCNNTPFADSLPAFRLLVASVTVSEGVLAPSVAMALELVRNSVMKQYPTLSPLLYPGKFATAKSPFVSISAMWEAFSLPSLQNQHRLCRGSKICSLPKTQSSLR